jgi:hypothetical protein
MRMVLVPFVVAAFGLPLMAVDGLGASDGAVGGAPDAYLVIGSFDVWLPSFPLLALAIGVTLALSAWNWDHQLNHVYALALPVSRVQYTLAKMSAGVVLALLPATALWLGGHVAAASIVLPEGLRAYPNELGVRFLMAILLSYGLFFALAAGTIKTTLRLATALVVIGVFATVGWDSLAPHVEIVASTNAVDVLMRWVIEAPGPFEVFTGSWALIDV